METKMTEQEGLKIINEMIAQAKNNFQKGSADVAIFWGYLAAGLSIANFILLQCLENSTLAYFVWWLAAPGWLISWLIQRKIDRTSIVRTPIDRIINMIWIGFGIAVAVLQVVFWSYRIPHNIHFIYMVPVIMLMYGAAQFATAAACRHKPYFWGSVVFWIGAVLSMLVAVWTERSDYQFLILAASVIIGFVVPNHLLNRKAQSDV